MERYVGDLITQIRQHVGQINYSVDSSGNPTQGLTQEAILEYLNDAQGYLQSRIIEAYPKAFLTTSTRAVVANQEAYTIDDNVFFGNKLILVEYTNNGQSDNYVPLDQISLRERNLLTGRNPDGYALRGNSILPSPIPTSGSGIFRFTYYRAVDALNVRRGQIEDAITVPDTDLGLYSSGGAATPDDAALSTAQYICACDAYGTVTDYNIAISSYSTSTDVITIPSQTVTCVVGNFVVTGKYSTTHSDLPEQCERFIKTYAQMRIFQKLGSSKAREEGFEMNRFLEDIIDSFSEEDHDIKFIPIVDYGLF